MKKELKIMGSVVMLVIVIVAVFNLTVTFDKTKSYNWKLEDAEAKASGEFGNGDHYSELSSKLCPNTRDDYSKTCVSSHSYNDTCSIFDEEDCSESNNNDDNNRDPDLLYCPSSFNNNKHIFEYLNPKEGGHKVCSLCSFNI